MAQGDKKKKSNGGGQAAQKTSGGERDGASASTRRDPASAGPSTARDEKNDKKEAATKESDEKSPAVKKGSGEAPAKKAGEAKPAKKADPEEKAVQAKAAKVEGHVEKKHEAAGHDHGHKVDRREYWIIFGVLFVLTVLEVAVAQIPGISKTLMAVALIGLAVAKAACVGLFYMHLKHETKFLRYTVAIPLAAPALYAFVLIAEAAWRLTR